MVKVALGLPWRKSRTWPSITHVVPQGPALIAGRPSHRLVPGQRRSRRWRWSGTCLPRGSRRPRPLGDEDSDSLIHVLLGIKVGASGQYGLRHRHHSNALVRRRSGSGGPRTRLQPHAPGDFRTTTTDVTSPNVVGRLRYVDEQSLRHLVDRPACGGSVAPQPHHTNVRSQRIGAGRSQPMAAAQTASARSSSLITRFLARCVTHSPVECAVIPASCT